MDGQQPAADIAVEGAQVAAPGAQAQAPGEAAKLRRSRAVILAGLGTAPLLPLLMRPSLPSLLLLPSERSLLLLLRRHFVLVFASASISLLISRAWRAPLPCPVQGGSTMQGGCGWSCCCTSLR